MAALKITLITFPDIQHRAVAQFNLHLSTRKGYGIAWRPMTLESAQWRLDRVAVNYIRHQLTSYDELMTDLLTEGAARDEIMQLQRQVLAMIADLYPEVAMECSRQGRLRGL